MHFISKKNYVQKKKNKRDKIIVNCEQKTTKHKSWKNLWSNNKTKTRHLNENIVSDHLTWEFFVQKLLSENFLMWDIIRKKLFKHWRDDKKEFVCFLLFYLSFRCKMNILSHLLKFSSFWAFWEIDQKYLIFATQRKKM